MRFGAHILLSVLAPANVGKKEARAKQNNLARACPS